MPALTMRQVEHFLGLVATQAWHGDQSVWLAAEDPAAAVPWLRCSGDWMRAVQPAAGLACAPGAALPAARRKTTRRGAAA